MNNFWIGKIGVAVGVALFALGARADYVTTFSVPPYKLDATALGINGWESRQNRQNDELTARVAAVRWNDSTPALILRGASIKNVFPPAEGSRVRVTLKIALAFPTDGVKRSQVRIGFSKAPFGEICFTGTAEGGLAYACSGSGTGGVVALPQAEIKLNSFYTLIIEVNYDSQTYDVTLTGVKRDGTPLSFEAKGLEFESKKAPIGSVYVLTGNRAIVYLEKLAVESM